MNDFAREVAEEVPKCHKTLNCMPEFQQSVKRLERLRKFMISQKKKSVRPKLTSNLSFEVSTG